MRLYISVPTGQYHTEIKEGVVTDAGPRLELEVRHSGVVIGEKIHTFAVVPKNRSYPYETITGVEKMKKGKWVEYTKGQLDRL